jgi:hypothetical protein
MGVENVGVIVAVGAFGLVVEVNFGIGENVAVIGTSAPLRNPS